MSVAAEGELKEASLKLKKLEAAFDQELGRYCRDLCRSVLDVFIEQKPRTDLVKLCMSAHALVNPLSKSGILDSSTISTAPPQLSEQLPLPELPELPPTQQSKPKPTYNFYPKSSISKKRKLPCLTSTKAKPDQKLGKDDDDSEGEDLDATQAADDAELKGQESNADYFSDPAATEADKNWIVRDDDQIDNQIDDEIDDKAEKRSLLSNRKV
jgi:hypothetical protein